ncbi:MAG TPA: YdeI/OmpD-associated family protein [Vicinamibacterales bacterium]|nr:YdeI/OmpD-associated family protein [Vicinamibacterales bacterium]
MKPKFFPTPAEWCDWLERHHGSADELWVGFRKRATGKPSLTWPEPVDEALCFGWIDGLRKSLGAESYMIRFTPRRSDSIWSAINVRRVGVLTRLGRMRPAGARAFKERTKKKTAIYSFEQRKEVKLPAAYARRFKENPDAWRFFSGHAPWYQRTTTWWVISAKREETRLRRLATLIADSAAGRRIGLAKSNQLSRSASVRQVPGT